MNYYIFAQFGRVLSVYKRYFSAVFYIFSGCNRQNAYICAVLLRRLPMNARCGAMAKNQYKHHAYFRTLEKNTFMQKTHVELSLVFLVLVLWAFPSLANAQITPPALSSDTLSGYILRIFRKDSPKTVVYFDLRKAAVELADSVRLLAPMRMGSFRLKWHTSKAKAFFIRKVQAGTTTCVLTLSEGVRLQIEACDVGLCVHLEKEKSRIQLAYINLYCPANEVFMGAGEQYSQVTLNGSRVPIFVEEQGIGRGDFGITQIANLRGAGGHRFSSFAPSPRLISTQGRVISCLSMRAFDLRYPEQLRLEAVFKDSLALHISAFSRETRSAFGTNYPKTGVPAWMFGSILGLQGGTDTVLQKLAVLEQAGVKPAAIWIQDWCGRAVTPYGKQLVWNWALDTVRYPRFKAFRDSLRQRDIRLLAYVNPFLRCGTPLAREAAQQAGVLLEKKGAPLVLPATGFDVFLANIQGADGRGRGWLKAKIQENIVGNGFSGWMADFGEWYPMMGAEDYAAHQSYPDAWAALNAEIVAKDSSLCFFSRSNFAQNNSPVYWAGDQNTTWGREDGLPSLVPALLSSGISGMLVNHGDIGGFTSFKKGAAQMTRSRELLYRWIEVCAFTPIFRTHEGLAPDANVQVYSDTASAAFFARFALIHDALKPYLLQTYREAAQKGLPMVRHLWLEFPDDPAVLGLEYEFMLGSDFLVMPVLKRGATTVRGYLPKGRWQHYFTHAIIESRGAWQVFDAPLGQPCVWRRLPK